MGQPYKACVTKRLEAFKARSKTWAEGIKRNRSMSHVQDDTDIVVR